MPSSKYALLKRSQLVIRQLQIESELLATNGQGKPRLKWGSARDRALRQERAQLLQEIADRDDAILAKWRAGWTYAARS